MVENLLGISGDLLNYIAASKTLSECEKDYIVGVVRKSVLLVLIELAKK